MLQGVGPWGWAAEVTSARCAPVIVSGRVRVPHCCHLGSAPWSPVSIWPGAAMSKDVLVAVQGLVLLWPLPHVQSRGCASFSSRCLRCFRLLCKLAGVMAQLASQLTDFGP